MSMTQQIVTGLRAVAADMERVIDNANEGNTVVVISLVTLNDWIGDIRACVEDLGDD